MNTNVRITTGIVFLFMCVIAVLGIVGCGGERKIEPVKLGEMETYRDPVYGYTLQYPKGWAQSTQVGRASFFNAQEVDKKFLDPNGPFPDGVVIAVEIIPTKNPDQERTRMLDEMTKNGFVLAKPEPVSVGGKQGQRITYSGQWSKSTKETGAYIYIPTDTLLYDIRFAGFAGLYEAYKQVFDALLASFQFPKAAVPGRDPTLPSETMVEYNGKLFSFQYPENYNSTNAPKGSNEEVYELRGGRQDCSIRFDVFGAKGLTAEKAFDQNKGKYRATSTGKATVSGLPAYTLTYSASRDVDRRFYFVVKNDKVYRITLDWFRPQRDDYLAIYERVIASVKIK